MVPEREPERQLPRSWTAAGAKIVHSLQETVMRSVKDRSCKERHENWRASLVPAAAVIPTPRVCMRVVAVKRPVVVNANRASSPVLTWRG